MLYDSTSVPAERVPSTPSHVHNAADGSCKSRENSVNLILSLAYSVSDSYEPRRSWLHKVNIDTSYSVSEYYYLAFVDTYLPIVLPKSFQSHAAECLLIDSSSSQLTNIAVAMETQPTQRSVAIILGPNNWTEWIRSI